MQSSPDAATVTSPGLVIRLAREKAKLSREKLASETGVSVSTIVRLERDGRLPNVPALARIAGRVAVPVADLFPAPEQVA